MLFSCKSFRSINPLCFLRWHSVESESYLTRTQISLLKKRMRGEVDIKKIIIQVEMSFTCQTHCLTWSPGFVLLHSMYLVRQYFHIFQHAGGSGKEIRSLSTSLSSGISWTQELIHKREREREEGRETVIQNIKTLVKSQTVFPLRDIEWYKFCRFNYILHKNITSPYTPEN